LAAAHYNLGRSLESAGDQLSAIQHYRRAVLCRDDYVAAHNNLAWILATDASEHVRDPDDALLHARRAVELTNEQNFAVLDTLATAYAAAGDFEKAVATADRALQLAKPSDLPPAQQIRRRLELFRNQQPFRMSAPMNANSESDGQKRNEN
jgi:spermidine synthase